MNPRSTFDSDLAPIDEEGEDELAAHAMHVVSDDDDDEDADKEDADPADKSAEDKDDPEFEEVLDGLAELEQMAKKQLENPEDSPIKGDYDE